MRETQKEEWRLLAALVAIAIALFTINVLRGQEPTPGPVVLCWSASWCQFCPQMKPIWASVEAGGVKVQRLDLDVHKSLAAAWGVKIVPTTIVAVRDGGKLRPVKAFSGVTTKEKIEQAVKDAR